MIVLGIETSCDETAAAVVDGERRILANVVASQIATHRPYGGVVPEIAARAHLAAIDGVVRQALADAGLGMSGIDAVAAAAGPGLIGGVLVGVTAAKAIAVARGIPFLAVNHLEGHALTPRLTDGVPFPYLLLLTSGGHCQTLIVKGPGAYRRLGTTIDDAAGEAFDKAAKMMGLSYPGGPEIERRAALGDAKRFTLPRPMLHAPGYDFSFSGLKTAVRQTLARLPGPPTEADVADLSAAFQAAVTDTLIGRVKPAVAAFRRDCPRGRHLVVAGGVAANAALRGALAALADESGLAFAAPPLPLCTDNGAMIAWAGLERLTAFGRGDGLDFKPRPRWPLDAEAPPARGAGVKA
jgi:N6-L-threonylcarbamoyladenine synthase